LHRKPEIGKPPSFLAEECDISLGTASFFKRCIDAVRNNKAYALGSFVEYCDIFKTNLERFRFSCGAEAVDESILKNIESFIPYRNEVVELFTTVARYSLTHDFLLVIHHFFEGLLPYMERPSNVSTWNENDFDNYKFIIQELFLYTVALLVQNEKFDEINYLFQQRYYVNSRRGYGKTSTVSFDFFWQYIESFENINRKKDKRRLSVRSDLLKERCTGVGVHFQSLMQADFIVFLRAEIDHKDDDHNWYPDTLLYSQIENIYGAFEIFARSISKSYFDRVKILLQIDSPADLAPLLQSYKDRSRQLPRWERYGFSPSSLLGFSELATLP